MIKQTAGGETASMEESESDATVGGQNCGIKKLEDFLCRFARNFFVNSKIVLGLERPTQQGAPLSSSGNFWRLNFPVAASTLAAFGFFTNFQPFISTEGNSSFFQFSLRYGNYFSSWPIILFQMQYAPHKHKQQKKEFFLVCLLFSPHRSCAI